MKKDSFYFSHDYTSRNDVKCLFLRQQLGMEGYGIFWFLVESLAEGGGFLPLKIIPVLAMQMQVPEIKVSAVITEFNLFVIEEGNFFSLRLNEHLNKRKMLSEEGKRGALLRWNNSPPNGLPNSNPNAKERKGKESKGNEIHGTNVPTHTPEEIQMFSKVTNWMKDKSPLVLKMNEPLTIDQYLKLKDEYPPETISEILQDMHNWKELLKKRVSAYRTFLKFVKNQRTNVSNN